MGPVGDEDRRQWTRIHHRSLVEPAVASIQAHRVVQAAPKARKARRRRLVSMVRKKTLQILGVVTDWRAGGQAGGRFASLLAPGIDTYVEIVCFGRVPLPLHAPVSLGSPWGARPDGSHGIRSHGPTPGSHHRPTQPRHRRQPECRGPEPAVVRRVGGAAHRSRCGHD